MFIFIVLVVLLAFMAHKIITNNKNAPQEAEKFDPFAILGISESASVDAIKSAFRELSYEFCFKNKQTNNNSHSHFCLIDYVSLFHLKKKKQS